MGAYIVPATFLNNTDEGKAAAKQLGAETATQEVETNKAEKKPVQAATKSAAAKQADTKQIKQQAAAVKEDAPLSTPVTPPHTRLAELCGYWRGPACAHLSPTLYP